MHARLVLARAVTVAVGYCAVRRQFEDRDCERGRDGGTYANAPTSSIASQTEEKDVQGESAANELQVLNYPTVQIRVLPLLATTFALHYTGEYMYALYHGSRETIEKGDFGPIAALHSASSGLKSLCTTLAADGIETCRRAMGGHGFGGGSSLVGLNAE